MLKNMKIFCHAPSPVDNVSHASAHQSPAFQRCRHIVPSGFVADPSKNIAGIVYWVLQNFIIQHLCQFYVCRPF
jgi:hypothetical protein